MIPSFVLGSLDDHFEHPKDDFSDLNPSVTGLTKLIAEG